MRSTANRSKRGALAAGLLLIACCIAAPLLIGAACVAFGLAGELVVAAIAVTAGLLMYLRRKRN